MTSFHDPDQALSQALALVRQGWGHLQLQRPQAAWASWQRALWVVPEYPAARQALETLESAPDLPDAARTTYRFLAPNDDDRRARWDRRLRDGDLERLDDAASAFAALAVEDPDDSGAAYNEGLCLAWLGRNVEAIGAIDRAVRLLAVADFDRAVEAWSLAEILRQGGGAETLADDLRFVWVAEGVEPDVVPRLASLVPLVPVPTPRDALNDDPSLAANEVYEWLDRPWPEVEDRAAVSSSAEVPRLLATLVRTPRNLRISSPDAQSLDEIQEPIARVLGTDEDPVRREAIPLPLPLLDAAVWMLRLPQDVDAEVQKALSREAVETFYEDRWIHIPRKGLDGQSPLGAACGAKNDPVLRARLTAVIRVREQLGARPRTALLYQGYPFDRVRRRLGLELIDPEAVDPQDYSCMSGAELDRLDPSTLDDVRLADVFRLASGLREDPRTARFAAELAGREPSSLAGIDLEALFAPLVRESLTAGNASQALAWLDRARAVARPSQRRTFEVWRAEVFVLDGEPEAALEAYESLLGQDPSDVDLALDAAETLLDNGYPDHARPLLIHARNQACYAGDTRTEERIRAIVDEVAL